MHVRVCTSVILHSWIFHLFSVTVNNKCGLTVDLYFCLSLRWSNQFRRVFCTIWVIKIYRCIFTYSLVYVSTQTKEPDSHCLCPLSSSAKARLTLASLTEFNVRNTRLMMPLHGSPDQAVCDGQPDVRTGRKWNVAHWAKTAENALHIQKVSDAVLLGIAGLGT